MNLKYKFKLPLDFDLSFYKQINPDLASIEDSKLFEHYKNHGMNEGRKANIITGRSVFVDYVKRSGKVIEIGPFVHPAITGPNVVYADYLGTDDLVRRAESAGLAFSNPPNIKYVLSKNSLGDIPEKFDAVFSSHCIEHQVDLIQHLKDVRKILSDDGRYFMVIPDKRYCFDRFNNISTIADIIDAHYNDKSNHSLKSVIEHIALITHNDPLQHWDSSVPPKYTIDPKKIRFAIDKWLACKGEYIDVHAWYFTPESFVSNINLLNDLGCINLQIERVYPTQRGAIEFYAVLSSSENGAATSFWG